MAVPISPATLVLDANGTPYSPQYGDIYHSRAGGQAQAREVFDVTGAGDTVIATLAAMLAAGVSVRDALPVANRAGGIVVGKFGTASVSYQELFA